MWFLIRSAENAGENGLHVSEKSYRWENVFCPESGWYKGDFHTHTRLSDGKETIRHASERAEESGLDFLCADRT